MSALPVDTIGTRLSDALYCLRLAHAAAGSVLTSTDRDPELIAAIARAAGDALESLFWIHRLPASVLNIDAPDDDAIEAAGYDVTEQAGRDAYFAAVTAALATVKGGKR